MLLDLPLVKQLDEFSCGSAVFKCVTAYWEGRGRKFRSHPHYGTHPDVLEMAFHQAGYNVLAGAMGVDTLKSLTVAGWPVCCLVKSEDTGHWVAVRGVERGKIHIMDPDSGFRAVKVGDWAANWSDFDRRGTVFRNYGLAVWC